MHRTQSSFRHWLISLACSWGLMKIQEKKSMDVARILIRTKSSDVFIMVVHANINGSMFHVKMFEEWCGPIKHWNGLSRANQYNLQSKETESGSESDGGDSDEEEEAEESQSFKPSQLSRAETLT